MTSMKIFITISTLTILLGCSRQTKDKKWEGSNDKTVSTNEQTKSGETIDAIINEVNTFIVDGDSVIIPAFQIKVSLSDKAEKELKKDNESIIVQAFFYGTPVDTTNTDYIEWGKILVGDSRVELFQERVATFKQIKISKEVFDGLLEKDFDVLINIFSGRRSSENNILNTDILEKKILEMSGQQFTLTGKLIFNDK